MSLKFRLFVSKDNWFIGLETLLDSKYISSKRLVKTFNRELINEIIEKEQSQSLYKIQQLVIDLNVKLTAAENEGEIQEENSTQGEDCKLDPCSNTTMNHSVKESMFERPMSLRVWMFQISESNNLERISNVLQNLCSYSHDHLYKLSQKYELDLKLIKIIQKYCNGDYGFDLNVSKQGIFQLNYFKAILKSFNCEILVEKLANSDFFELYGQLIEESLIFAFDYTFKIEMPTGCKIFDFLQESLKIFYLLKKPKFVHHISGILEILAKLSDRLQKVSMSENSM